jgi:hypothetical protein
MIPGRNGPQFRRQPGKAILPGEQLQLLISQIGE